MRIKYIMQDIGYYDNDDADDDFDNYQQRARQLLIDTTRKNLENLEKAGLNKYDVFIISSSVIFSLVNAKVLRKITPTIDEARLFESILKVAHARQYGNQASAKNH